VSRLLLLTSPPLRGHDVLDVQRELRRLHFQPGPLDGIYGATTAAAVRRFQRHRELTPDGIVGPATGRVLHDAAAKPPPDHHGPSEPHGSHRGALPGREPPGFRALLWMRQHGGMTEHPPNSNHCPVTVEFGLGNVPWCMETVSLAFKHGAGLVLGDDHLPAPWGYWPGRGFAYVPAFQAWSKTRGYWIGRTAPEAGDVACYLFGHSEPVHVGIVDRYLGGGVFEAMEGNTGIGNDANGGELMRRRRYVSQVSGFARIVPHRQA
jgi:hypothetical protein